MQVVCFRSMPEKPQRGHSTSLSFALPLHSGQGVGSCLITPVPPQAGQCRLFVMREAFTFAEGVSSEKRNAS